MPKIPQYQGGENIHTGSTGPQANPDSFGADGLQAVGQGLANVAGSLTDIHDLKEKQRQDDERLWLRSSSTQLEKVFSEYTADEKNQAKDTFATDFQEFAQKQAQEYGKAAPSGRAAKVWKVHADELSFSFQKSANHQAAKTRERNALMGFDQQAANALLSYRNNLNSGNPEATELLRQNVSGIFGDIEARFGEVAPDVAEKAEAKLVRDVVLATAKQDPAFAKEVLHSATMIDEPLRQSLTNHIEQEANTGDALVRAQVDLLLDNALKEGQKGNPIPAVDERMVKAAFGDKPGAAKMLKFNAAAKIWNEANSITAKLSDKNAGYQQAELSKLAQTADPDAVQIAVRKLDDNQRQQQKDPAAFMRQQNQEVQAAYEQAIHAPDSLKAQYANIAHSVSLKYQGYAPADASPEEAAKYLSLPTGQRHVLPAGEAKALGARLAQGSISDQLKVIDEMLAGYDEDHQFIAFNDLVTYADIPPALQLAHLNRGKTWLNEYINVALKPDILSKLTPDSQKTFSDELDKNAQWNLFTRSLYADGQRIREVGAWRSGIVAYANALAFKGEKPADATAKAFKRLVEDNLGFPTVHGEPVMVSKVRRDGSMRNDQEIADYGRKLTNALRDIPPQDIKILDDQGVPYFLSLPQLPEGDVLKQQHLRDIITSRGFYRPNPDGQSVSVYLVDDNGTEFQVRDKANQPLEIELDALPQFGTSRYSVFGAGGNMGLGGQAAINDKISATYKIDPKAPVQWGGYWKNQGGTRSSRIKQRSTTLEGPK